MAYRSLEQGSGVLAPANTTRYNYTKERFEFFRAFADGYSGWLPNGAIYGSGGTATVFSHYDNTSVTIDGRTSGAWHPVFETIALSNDPQNSVEYLPVDLDNARRGLAWYGVNPDCSNFIEKLLNTAAEADVAYYNPRVQVGGRDAGILDLFDFARGRIVRGVPEGNNGGQATGSAGTNDLGVTLSGLTFGRPDFSAREKGNIVLEIDIRVLLHELIHLGGVNTYTDYQLALAVGRITGTPIPLPTGHGPMSDARAYGTFWDTELRKHCKDFRVKL